MPEPLPEQKSLLLRYHRTQSRTVRDRLLEHYLPLVHVISRRVLLSGSTSLDLEDLIGIGSLTLFDSLKRYDPERGVPFSVFASHRIRGAILDEFRKLNTSRRAGRQVNPALSGRREEFHWSSDPEGEGGLTETSSYKIDGLKSFESLDLLVDPKANGSIDNLERREIIDHLTTTLSARERVLLRLYYERGVTMREISKRLGLSVPRISAMHTSILDRLQARFKELRHEVFS